jgi:hypothetical protein
MITVAYAISSNIDDSGSLIAQFLLVRFYVGRDEDGHPRR